MRIYQQYQVASARPRQELRRRHHRRRPRAPVMSARGVRHCFAVDPTVTVKQVREMMLSDGIRPEGNEFSREIIRMRNELY
jgi:hypothetical protein